MFKPDQLANFNAQMLSGGAPNEIDYTGYNKPDFLVCKGYLDVLTDAQLADLSSRLIKYSKTQLNISKQEMQETADYYNSLTTNTQLSNSISIKIHDEFTEIAFDYDSNYVNAVKSASNRKYMPDTKTWYVHNSEIVEILVRLQAKGADVQSSIDYVLTHQINIPQQPEQTNPQLLEIKVTEQGNKLTLSNKYHAEIVSAIKSLDNRKYNPDTKTWTIAKTEVPNLLPKLQKIVGIDFSQLLPYAENIESEVTAPVEYIKIQIPVNVLIDPFPHQIEAGEFLLNKHKAILGDDMGLGKTFSAVLAGSNIQGKKLVVCPASLKLNWEKEIHLVPNQKTEVINGKGWQECEGWTIVNYDILSKHIDPILNGNFACVIFDEAHYCKALNNSGKATSKRANMFLQIAEKVENVYVLTGTPINNHTKDIYNLLKAIEHPLSEKFFSFAQRYCGPSHNGYGWDFNGSSNTAELNEKLKPYMMRRLKGEILDLPEKIRSFIPVAINLKEYNKKLKEYMSNRKKLSDKGEHLVYLNGMRHLLAKEKVVHTIEIAQNLLEQGEQVVILTNYTHVVDTLMEKFGDVAVKLTGETSQKDRQLAVDLFQAGEKKVFVGNLIASGVGITLTASRNIIVNDYDWVPSNHAQGEDRIHRIGQKNQANITYVYANGTFDEDITQMLEEKLNNISMIVDGKSESFINNIIDRF